MLRRVLLQLPALLGIVAGVTLGSSIERGRAETASDRPIQSTQADTGRSYLDQLIERARALLDEDADDRDPARAALLLEEAVRAGSTSAMHLLSDLYATGDGVTADFARARQLLEDAIAAGDETFGSRDLGDLYSDAAPPNRDLAKAEAAYQRAIDLGDSVSMIALARMLTSPDGLPPDYTRARDLFERAVIAGDVIEGSRALGELLRSAPPPVRDPEGAVAAYQRAVDLGDVSSMFALADMLAIGDGVPIDFDRARDLLLASIAAGKAEDGASALGDLYLEADAAHRDPVAAIQAYELAIGLGDTGSMISLAQMLAEGNGVPVDFDRARKLLETAIAAGAERAGWRALGDIYKDAAADRRDPVKAAEAYQKAADLGDNGARITLGKMLAVGEGIPVNFDGARMLFEAVIANGDVRDGSQALGDLYRDADAPDRRPALAVAAYTRAAELGDPWAMISLARMLAAGDGVPMDFDRARTLLEEAIEAGQPVASLSALGELYRRAEDPIKAVGYLSKAVELGGTSAMVSLAEIYASGNGVPVDFNRARMLLESAIAGGNMADGARTLGDLYRHAGAPNRDIARARQYYEMAIGVGDTTAMIELAGIYAYGDGVPAEFDKALALLQQAIGAGDIRHGSRALGDLYRYGDEARRDPAKAMDSYRVAIGLGDPSSMITVASILSGGEGVPVDFDGARELLEAAITAGSVGPASLALGDLYRAAGVDHRDPRKAEAAYQRAIDLGDPWGMLQLGRMVAEADGIPYDFERALTLFEGAIDAGQPSLGWRFLGDLYLEAPPAFGDSAKAAEAYQKGADLGNASAMLALAELYADGYGVKKDFDHAVELIEAAIAAGEDASGTLTLGDIYRDETSVNRDLGKAREAYERAASLGNTSAMAALAEMYQKGEGVAVDFEQARTFLEQAVAGGAVSSAAMDLGDLFLNMPEDKRDPLKAAAAYKAAAKAGNERADLALGLLLLQEVRDPQTYESAGQHLRTAAGAMGAKEVAGQMMRMPAQALVSVVQQYLRGDGYGGSVDGIHGRGTETAINAYCEAKTIKNCDGTFISFDLLLNLLSRSSSL